MAVVGVSTAGIEVRIVDSVAVLTLDHPPVNGLSHAARSMLFQRLRSAADDRAVRAIVLTGAGRGFSAGGDTRELGTPASSAAPGLSADVHPAIERCRKPVIAALHGFAIGGGFETALACHYRIAQAQTRLGLPEVQLGILPLSGTQRIPRLLDLATTLELIVAGRRFEAAAWRHTDLFDRIVDGPDSELLPAALDLAQEVLLRPKHPLVRDRPPVSHPGAERLAALRAEHATGSAAVRAAIESIAAAYELATFEAGIHRVRLLYDELERGLAGPAARAPRPRPPLTARGETRR